MGNDYARPCPDLSLVDLGPILGEPWTPEYNCWSMVRDFYRRAGVDLPEVAMNPASLRSAAQAGSDPENYLGWELTQEPRRGDVACMTHSRKDVVTHVGVVLDSERHVLHNLQGSGVVVTPPGRLALLGLRVIGYWYWRDVYGTNRSR